MSDDRLLNLLAELASEARDLGCTEADLRAVDLTTEWLVIRNGRLETEAPTYDKGVGVRVRMGPSAGFAATPKRDAKSIRAALVAAAAMARETKSLAHS